MEDVKRRRESWGNVKIITENVEHSGYWYGEEEHHEQPCAPLEALNVHRGRCEETRRKLGKWKMWSAMDFGMERKHVVSSLVFNWKLWMCFRKETRKIRRTDWR